MLDEFPDLEALKAGDNQAWTCAFHDLWPLAVHAAMRQEFGLHIEEAHDAASEALAQLVAQIGNVKAFEEIKALVVTIAYRRAVSLARRKSAAKRLPENLSVALDSGNEEISSASAIGETSDLSGPELLELVAVLAHFLTALDVETRQLLTDKIGHGLSYLELSQKHGIPLGTACAKVARGLRKLRQSVAASPHLMKELKAFLR